jgi:hypothetical protein
VRQGVISKAWLGTGEEAATVGPVHALRRLRTADFGLPAASFLSFFQRRGFQADNGHIRKLRM